VNRLTTVSQIDERGTLAYKATGRTDSKRMFRAARRHSRFVRVVRVAIPVGIVIGALAIFVVATLFDPLRMLARLPINIGGVVVSGTKITMQQPRLAGFTQDARPYVVTARAAAQDVTKPDLLELQDIRGTMEMKDSGAFELVAESGIFETKADKLTLHRNILLNSSNYQVRLSEAVVNVRTGHVVSDRPVEVTMTQGVINANRMEVINSAEVIRFENGVTMVLTSPTPQTNGQAGAP
jgi:lipopolysaccharide export system protein LptC